jgi:hypothetical protein
MKKNGYINSQTLKALSSLLSSSSRFYKNDFRTIISITYTMNNVQLMEIIQAYKDGKATIQQAENAVKEFAAEIKQQHITKELQADNCPLSDEELCLKVDKWVTDLCRSGGKDWCLRVPVDMRHDPDVLISTLVKRFKSLRQQ